MKHMSVQTCLTINYHKIRRPGLATAMQTDFNRPGECDSSSPDAVRALVEVGDGLVVVERREAAELVVLDANVVERVGDLVGCKERKRVTDTPLLGS